MELVRSVSAEIRAADFAWHHCSSSHCDLQLQVPSPKTSHLVWDRRLPALDSACAPVTWRCPTKPPYLSCWEPQLVLPHSALCYFSFPGPLPKGTSEQSEQGSSHTTPGGVSPLLCHCSAKPAGLFTVTSPLTRSCFKTFWNTGWCSSVAREESLVVWLGPVKNIPKSKCNN